MANNELSEIVVTMVFQIHSTKIRDRMTEHACSYEIQNKNINAKDSGDLKAFYRYMETTTRLKQDGKKLTVI